MIRLAVFDLDGTLTDSSTTIYKSTHRTFQELGLPYTIEKSVLDSKIGEHFQNIFDDLNIQAGNIDEFINVYKGFYFDYIPETVLYPGVEDILQYLQNKGIQTALLTTKGQDQAEKIIHAFNLEKYFALIMGRRPGIAVKPSGEPLSFIMKELGADAAETMMIGDSELDIQCGKNAGAATAGCLYGYRTREILEREAPDYIIGSITELKDIL